MINITYLPSLDPYHAIFRLLTLFPEPTPNPVSIETARVLDFYVCFPFLISEFRPAREFLRAHNQLKKRYVRNEYQVTPKSATLFQKMRPVQGAAFNTLQAYGFIDAAAFRTGSVLRTTKTLSPGVSAQVRSFRAEHAQLVDFLGDLMSFPLLGPSGLKARTGLEEFRYDDV